MRTLLTKTRKIKARVFSEEKARKARALSEEKARKYALARLPSLFSPKTLGQGSANAGGRAGRQAREDCLQRLFLRSSLLPVDLAAQWPELRKWFAGYMVRWGSSTGLRFTQGVNNVIVALGSNFKPGVGKTAKLDSALGCVGDLAAFEEFVRMMRAKMLEQSSTASASVTANGEGSDGSDDSSPSSVAANELERKRRRATSNSKDSRNPELSLLLSINESH